MRQTRISTFTNCSRICILVNMHASVRGSYTKWYVKVGGHYWHQILLSIFLWAKSTTERWSREGSFSPYAIYSGRALSVQTRWNSIFCRVARISMSHVLRCTAFGPFRRAWEEGQGSSEKSRASVFHVLTRRVFTNFWHGKYWHCILLRAFSRR